VRKIVRDAGKDGYRFSSLILGITKSDPFQLRQAAVNEKLNTAPPTAKIASLK